MILDKEFYSQNIFNTPDYSPNFDEGSLNDIFQNQQNNEISPSFYFNENQSENTIHYLGDQNNFFNFFKSHELEDENDLANSIKKTKTNLFISEKRREISYRLEYYKKHFKVNFIKYLKNYGNELIKKSPFPKKIKKKLIFSSPNSILFTSDSKDIHNYNFLNLTINEILILGRKSSSGSLQQKNYEVIEKIKKILKENESVEFNEIKNFLFIMTLEDAYKLFYESNDFVKFCNDEKTKFYDREFIKEKHFSLLEKFGFIHLIKMFGKKEKENEIN